MKTTTIFEISKILNLSPSTISRALKNHPDIAPETRKRILEVAEKLDYEPNLFAVGLRKNKSREIAVIVPTLSGFFYDSFISAVEEEARRLHYSLVVLLSGDDPEVELQNVKTCKQRRVDGILLCVTSRTTDTAYFSKIQAAGVPLIFFDKVPEMPDVNTVCVADETAAQLAADALISKQKKAVLAIFADLHFSITKKRLDAFRSVFQKAGMLDSLDIEHALNSIEAETIVKNAFSESKHDAIFCMSDEILIGVMKSMFIANAVPGRDLSIIAISNGFFPKLYHPEVTYVETSGYKLGKLSIKRMMELIDGSKDFKNLIVESSLVEGGSL